MLIFHADNEKASFRGDEVSEVIKDLEIGLFGMEKIQMIRLNGGDYGNIGAIAQQGGIGFIRLCNEGLTSAAVGVGACAIELAADGEGRIEAGMLHGAHCHGRGGSLAVGASQQHLLVALHQCGEQVGAADDRDIVLFRSQ